MKSLERILTAACRERDHPWALATLVRTVGSTYRRPGARLLISPDGTTTGVLSGGCLEEEIARIGLEVMAEKSPKLVPFDTQRLYGCDGKLAIFIERIEPAGDTGNFLTAVAARIKRREICRVRIDGCGQKARATVARASCPEPSHSELLPDHALVIEREDCFVETLPLPVRLLIFGDGPEIAPIRLFAAGLGWCVSAYRHPSELPADFVTDSQSAAVVMTHNFGRDFAALDRLLPLELPYLGLLGPKRRHLDLIARLQEIRELEPAWLDNLFSPAGLDIGSEAPEEIALAIVSEAAAVLADRRGGFLRNRVTGIHSVCAKEA